MFEHVSVLYQEALDALNITAQGLYIDGTLGAGGHTRGIMERGGRVLAFDWDDEAISFAQEQLDSFGDQVQFVHASYGEMGQRAPEAGFAQVDGVLLDLGLSSRQLDNPQRGFSFRFDAPLDMRFDKRRSTTAADLVNTLSESDLADIFWRYGDEKRSRRYARVIVANRPITTTTELADLIAAQAPKGRRIHPATKVFQALRIAVNGELDALATGLDGAVDLLKPGGRLAVISFHSLEDRYVKNLFRDLSQEQIWPANAPEPDPNWRPILQRITRKPIVPSADEVSQNPRSRSAKLRVAEKRDLSA